MRMCEKDKYKEIERERKERERKRERERERKGVRMTQSHRKPLSLSLSLSLVSKLLSRKYKNKFRSKNFLSRDRQDSNRDPARETYRFKSNPYKMFKQVLIATLLVSFVQFDSVRAGNCFIS